MKPTMKPERSAEQRAEEEAIRRQHAAKPVRQRLACAVNQQSFSAILSLLARFKAVRESQGLTLAEVAQRMEIDPPVIGRLKRGQLWAPQKGHRYIRSLKRRSSGPFWAYSCGSYSASDPVGALALFGPFSRFSSR